MEKELEKIYLTYYNLWIAQDSWLAHYEIFPIIFQKEFIKLNANTYMKISINENYQRKFDEKLKEQFLITAVIILFHKFAYPYK